MAQVNLEMKFQFAWWFRFLYLPGMSFVAHLFALFGVDIEPDHERLRQVCERALIVYTRGPDGRWKASPFRRWQ